MGEGKRMANDNKAAMALPPAPHPPSAPPDEKFNLAALTRQHVEAAIRELGPERAWRALGVARTTLYRWMRKWKREDRAADADRAAGDATGEVSDARK